MAETKQISFELQELAIALVRYHNIHDGKWMLGFEFDFGAANFGPTDKEVRPTAFARVKSAMLVRAEDAKAEIPFVVDAAEVNPAPGKAAEPSKKRAG